MKLHIARIPDGTGAMCGVTDEDEYMLNADVYLIGNKATKYQLGIDGEKPFTEWCEECITSSDMAFFMLAELA